MVTLVATSTWSALGDVARVCVHMFLAGTPPGGSRRVRTCTDPPTSVSLLALAAPLPMSAQLHVVHSCSTKYSCVHVRTYIHTHARSRARRDQAPRTHRETDERTDAGFSSPPPFPPRTGSGPKSEREDCTKAAALGRGALLRRAGEGVHVSGLSFSLAAEHASQE